MDNAYKTITIKLKAAKEEYVNGLYDHLNEEFSAGEWELDLWKEEYRIEHTELGVAHFYPGKMTLPNGDPGYPDEWEEEFEVYEGDVEEVIEKYITEHFQGEEISDWNVTADIEFIDRGYDDV